MLIDLSKLLVCALTITGFLLENLTIFLVSVLSFFEKILIKKYKLPKLFYISEKLYLRVFIKIIEKSNRIRYDASY